MICVVLFTRLLHEGAELEGRLLRGLLSAIVMILVIALAAMGMRRLGASGAGLSEELVFEEAYPAEITSLGLH